MTDAPGGRSVHTPGAIATTLVALSNALDTGCGTFETRTTLGNPFGKSGDCVAAGSGLLLGVAVAVTVAVTVAVSVTVATG
jgi:hypothetical protein